jgi:hypothetical protein
VLSHVDPGVTNWTSLARWRSSPGASGIGRSVVDLLASGGASVVAADFDPVGGRTVAAGSRVKVAEHCSSRLTWPIPVT